MREYKEIWEFNLDVNKLYKLSLADLLSLQIYIHQTGEGNTNNHQIIKMALLKKINELA